MNRLLTKPTTGVWR
ncbi:hypothetical protein GQ600_11519 [Phytophthora cactorum]|nr:hypothetical protein GQ600_11519 [Phytophthora cactorum]